jgi:hypothetical protein
MLADTFQGCRGLLYLSLINVPMRDFASLRIQYPESMRDRLVRALDYHIRKKRLCMRDNLRDRG